MVAMTTPLHRAAERTFWCHLYSSVIFFANCSKTPASTLNLNTSLESQWNIDSNGILSVRKYYQLFTHESNTFLGEQYASFRPFKRVGRKCRKVSETSLPLEARGPHLIHQFLGWPHSPPQMASGSYQPFCHNTLRTDRQTDRQMVQVNVR